MQRQLERLSKREFEILNLISRGSTDREIAQSLFLSVNTVKWHNRQIYAKLGVNSRTQAVAAASKKDLLDAESLHKDPGEIGGKHNLPAQVSSFVGRDSEIERIKLLLETSRLLTLSGTAGVGKTRLALQVASELVDDQIFKDGVYFVELAPVSKPERVPEVILEALGLIKTGGQPVVQILENYLESRKLLLIIDNFEHLIDAAQLVWDLLSKAPHLNVLCTSREALNLTGEQIYSVPPLTLADLRDQSSFKKLWDVASVDLFIQRVKAINPDFDPGENDLQKVAEICVRLDGLPLAIELAAAQIIFFNLNDLLVQMEDRFAYLKDAPRDMPERHQTLNKAIDWSYQLLTNEEKTLFNRLSVFQGGRTIEAVEQVCCHDLSLHVLDGLGSLFAKNLIQQEEGTDGELRFIMLETIHEFARNSLKSNSESEDMFRRHAQYYTELAEKGKYPTRGGPDRIYWMKRLKAEHDNLRAMYAWAMNNGDVELALRLVGALGKFWMNMGSWDEGEQWVTEALQVIDDAPSVVKAAVYFVAGMMYYWGNEERELSKQMYKKALKLYQQLGDKREMGWVYSRLMNPSEMIPEEREESLDNYEKAVLLLNEVGDKCGISIALNSLGVLEEFSGNNSKARKAYKKGLVIAQEIGDRWLEVSFHLNLACVQFYEGNFETAQKMYKESLELGLSLGLKTYFSAANGLLYLAGPAASLGQPRRAVVLLSASDMLFKSGANKPKPAERDIFQEYNKNAHEQLDDQTYEQAWAEGQAMDPEDAIAYALEDYDPA